MMSLLATDVDHRVLELSLPCCPRKGRERVHPRVKNKIHRRTLHRQQKTDLPLRTHPAPNHVTDQGDQPQVTVSSRCENEHQPNKRELRLFLNTTKLTLLTCLFLQQKLACDRCNNRQTHLAWRQAGREEEAMMAMSVERSERRS